MENCPMEAAGSLLDQKSLVCFIFIIPHLVALILFLLQNMQENVLVFLQYMCMFSISEKLMFAVLIF